MYNLAEHIYHALEILKIHFKDAADIQRVISSYVWFDGNQKRYFNNKRQNQDENVENILKKITNYVAV